MTLDIAAILAMDGIANGAVYLLAGLGLVLVFSVTRVIFLPFGDIAALAGLSLATLQLGRVPGTVQLIAVLAVIATLMEVVTRLRAGEMAALRRGVVLYGGLPLAVCTLAWAFGGRDLPDPLRILLALGLVLPLGPLLDRIAFRPIANASILVLFVVALALHFALSGLGLVLFGPEGFRTTAFVGGIFEPFPGLIVTGQTLLMLAAAAILGLMFAILFESTLVGKALRATAVNRIGARLVGIRPERTSVTAYLIASGLAGVAGLLVAPINTVYYDSGFIIGLKAFVGAIIGGLASYPLMAAGAIFVGILESFASFWSSSMKEVVVFSVLIPVLIWRSYNTAHGEDEDEEEID